MGALHQPNQAVRVMDPATRVAGELDPEVIQPFGAGEAHISCRSYVPGADEIGVGKQPGNLLLVATGARELLRHTANNICCRASWSVVVVVGR